MKIPIIEQSVETFVALQLQLRNIARDRLNSGDIGLPFLSESNDCTSMRQLNDYLSPD